MQLIIELKQERLLGLYLLRRTKKFDFSTIRINIKIYFLISYDNGDHQRSINNETINNSDHDISPRVKNHSFLHIKASGSEL